MSRSIDIRVVRRVLRQMREAGCGEVLFPELTAEEAVRLVRAAAAGASTGTGTRTAAGAGTVTGTGTGAGKVAGAGAGAADFAAVRNALVGESRDAGAGVGWSRAEEGDRATRRLTAPGEREGKGALAVLAQECEGCRRCRLFETRRHVVFGEGVAAADVVVVGEAPGQEEDRTGRPFVGRAGKLLDLLLLTAGFARESVYICNVLKCRPPQNRNPLPDEVAQCTTTFLHPQLDAIAPRVMVAVGKFAAQALLATEESIGRLRGRVHEYRGTPLVVTYHPAFLLRSPHMNRVAWHDFQLLRRVYDEQS
jgi:uracil-DNA glycosylase